MLRRPDTLPELVHLLVTNAPNGRRAGDLAEDLGKLHQTLLNEANPNYPTHKFGVEHLVPLARAAGAERLVGEFVAMKMGGVHVDLRGMRRLAGRPAGDVLDACLLATNEFGDVAGGLRKALAPESGGGRDITPDEAKGLLHEIVETMQALAMLEIAVRQAAGLDDGGQA